MSVGKTADVIIIGAGVMGSSIAFHLARRKAGRVVVIERDRVAWGASGRSSALVRMHYSFPPEARLAVKSLEIFKNWEEIVGEPTHFRKTGFVRIVPEIELLKANVAMLKENGVNTRLISAAELKAIEPDWHVNDVAAAAYEPESGYADGAGVAGDFLSKAREMGVTYLPRTRVMYFKIEGGRVRGVATDQGEIDAPVVVSAAGQWTQPLFRHAGLDVPIETEYHEVAILKNPAGMKGGGCACVDSTRNVYFRSDGPDKTLVGELYGRRGVDPDNFPQRASQESLAEIAKRLCGRIPVLEDAELVCGVTGVYDMSPDSRPLLGEIPDARGLHVVAGFSGTGFKLSPAIGLVMSELLLDGHSATVDISAFRPGRFGEGKPIKAEFEYQGV